MTFPLVTQLRLRDPRRLLRRLAELLEPVVGQGRADREAHVALVHGPALTTPPGVSLLFHTLNPFNGIAFLPVQLAFGLLPAYNAVVVFSFVAGGLGAYLLARYVLGPGSSRLAAFVAGAIFTFAPYHIAHLLGHMQLIALEWLPVLRALPAARRRNTSKTGSPAKIALATLFLVLVALCDWYYVFYCLILIVVVAAWVIVRRDSGRRSSRCRSALRGVAAIAAVWLVAAVVLSPLLVPMVREALAADYMVPDPAQSRTFSADLLAFVTPQGFHPLWGEWARKAERGVHRHDLRVHRLRRLYRASSLAPCRAGCAARRGRGMKGLWLAVALVFFVLVARSGAARRRPDRAAARRRAKSRCPTRCSPGCPSSTSCARSAGST